MFFRSAGCRNINSEELNDKILERRDFFLLDVRTPQENAQQAIPGSTLIPLQELGFRAKELPQDKEIVVYCRTGNRSAYACMYLSQQGFRVSNLEGGIVTWNRSSRAATAAAFRSENAAAVSA